MCLFGIELNNIHNMKNIHENDVNIISEFDLLHDILNPYECVKALTIIIPLS